MANPLLSTYRTGENRVTSSTMAVFERLDLALVQELLGAATGAGSELRAVTFENQVVNDEAIPDARITGRFTWWFETKTARGGYGNEGHDRQQLRSHSKQLVGDPDALLFILTPDSVRPSWIGEPDGVDPAVLDRILWLSFRDLARAIEVVVGDPARPLGEQTKFLLAELVMLYESDGLLANDDTVIVAARSAWPEYRAVGAYICQPDRSFREGLTHFGFYAEGAIQPLIPMIDQRYPSVTFTRGDASERRDAGELALADLIETVLDEGRRTEGESYGVLLLTGPDDDETVRLDRPIVNDTTTSNGKPWAWTLGQRYTMLERLAGAARTSDL